MYIALLGRFYGNDCVVRYRGDRDDTIIAGDLIIVGGHYGVVLGSTVSRPCDYTLNQTSLHLAESWLLSPQSMRLIHRIVREYYSSYRKVLPLWLTNDIESLLKRKTQTPSSASAPWPHLIYSWSSRTRDSDHTPWQQCLIFPDLWTIYSTIPKSIRTHKNVSICSSSMTEKQRNDARRAIKYNKNHIVLSTPAAFFHDRHQLSDMKVIDPHLRYYKNRQNPRYDVSIVIQKYLAIFTEDKDNLNENEESS